MSDRLWNIGEKPVVLAHRGGGNEEPENSMQAFKAMRDKGFRFIETDVHATKDGVVIIFHDPMLDRLTDSGGLVKDHTWRDLQDIQDTSGNTPLRLDEVLEEFPDIVFNVDAKVNSVVRPLIRTLKRQNAIEQVSLASFSEARLKVLRFNLPGVRSSLGMATIGRLVVAAHGPARLRKSAARGIPGPKKGVECVQVPVNFRNINVVDDRFVDLAHSRGLAVHVWTVNDEEDMRDLLDLGVDALITDEPTLARNVIAERW